MKYLISALASASLVAGHGYVTNGTIGGKSYTFYQPYTDPYTSPTPERISRPIQGNGPITDVTIADVQCGGDTADGIVGSSPAALHAEATAGSDVTLYWTLWPESHYGAIVTYMARCPDTGCQDYMPNSTTVWFKIDEGGMEEYNGGGTTDTWAVDPLMEVDNAGYTYTIPECLADGFYLVRHEIIAVFLAGSYPGAQLFPGCHQLNITGGSGSTTVTDDLVAFPGAYAATDPGITWDSSSTTYPIPGPSVFSCSGSSGSDSASSSATSATAAVETSAAATSSAAAVETATSSTLATTLSTAVVSSGSTASATPTSAATSAVVVAAASAEASSSSSSSSSAAATATEASSSKTCSSKRSLRRNKQRSSQ